jgi:hypothetical protein
MHSFPNRDFLSGAASAVNLQKNLQGIFLSCQGEGSGGFLEGITAGNEYFQGYIRKILHNV